MASNFSAQVADWVARTQEASEDIFRTSANRVVDEMQKTRAEGGNMPVDTGYLRASLMASNSSMPQIRADAKPAVGGAYGYDAGPVSLTINNTNFGGVVYVGYGASYSAYVNYGTEKTPARMFVELAAQKWPAIVTQVQGELRSRLAS